MRFLDFVVLLVFFLIENNLGKDSTFVPTGNLRKLLTFLYIIRFIRFILNIFNIKTSIIVAFLLSLGCTVDGSPGDGTTQGTCNEGEICFTDGICLRSPPGSYFLCKNDDFIQSIL